MSAKLVILDIMQSLIGGMQPPIMNRLENIAQVKQYFPRTKNDPAGTKHLRVIYVIDNADRDKIMDMGDYVIEHHHRVHDPKMEDLKSTFQQIHGRELTQRRGRLVATQLPITDKLTLIVLSGLCANQITYHSAYFVIDAGHENILLSLLPKE